MQPRLLRERNLESFDSGNKLHACCKCCVLDGYVGFDQLSPLMTRLKDVHILLQVTDYYRSSRFSTTVRDGGALLKGERRLAFETRHLNHRPIVPISCTHLGIVEAYCNRIARSDSWVEQPAITYAAESLSSLAYSLIE
jgi:hypothetical protein